MRQVFAETESSLLGWMCSFAMAMRVQRLGDIAEQAGIFRPALCLIFPRKEDIFDAVIERLIQDTATI